MDTKKNVETIDRMGRELTALEDKEVEFLGMKRRFERSLEDFRFQFQYYLRQEEELLHSCGDSIALHREMDQCRFIHEKVSLYTEDTLHQLSQIARGVQREIQQQRENLAIEKRKRSLP